MPKTKQSGPERRAYNDRNKPSYDIVGDPQTSRRTREYRRAATALGFGLDTPNRVIADDDLESAAKSDTSKRTMKRLGAAHNKDYAPGEDYPKGTYYSKGGSVRGDGCAVKGRTKGRHC